MTLLGAIIVVKLARGRQFPPVSLWLCHKHTHATATMIWCSSSWPRQREDRRDLGERQRDGRKSGEKATGVRWILVVKCKEKRTGSRKERGREGGGGERYAHLPFNLFKIQFLSPKVFEFLFQSPNSNYFHSLILVFLNSTTTPNSKKKKKIALKCLKSLNIDPRILKVFQFNKC